MKAVVTVIGKDKPGIIARVSALLAENAVNIEDISQTILSGNFTMLMYTDISESALSLAALSDALKEIGKEIGVSIHVQHEDIFNAMHKI
ncbi:MAG: ACT domain-containing protein [Bacillota bacterium]|nr:MAG: ACT domain-containing protein [Bacillota bacterium]